MNFNKLNEIIPYVVGGKSKILSMQPYNAVTLRLPGRHAKDTDPVGGDFVVCVDDEEMDWTSHQFTHSDLFADLEKKTRASSEHPGLAYGYMKDYLAVIQGADPEKFVSSPDYERTLPGIHPTTFLYAVQCLAVAEHRRYAVHEKRWGGRFLPFRASAGIVDGLWSAIDASERTRKRGRIGVEWLEKEFGTPMLTKELMNA